jgi:hypothetical protein
MKFPTAMTIQSALETGGANFYFLIPKPTNGGRYGH